jgi:hypothetical protein
VITLNLKHDICNYFVPSGAELEPLEGRHFSVARAGASIFVVASALYRYGDFLKMLPKFTKNRIFKLKVIRNYNLQYT